MRLFPSCLLLGLVPGLFGNPKSCSASSFTYTPLHAILPEKEHFFHLGNAATYEVALTFADSGFVTDMKI